jgi:hypothetical protein
MRKNNEIGQLFRFEMDLSPLISICTIHFHNICIFLPYNIVHLTTCHLSELFISPYLISSTYRWDIEMPSIIEGSVLIMSRTGLGLRMLSMGMLIVVKQGRTILTNEVECISDILLN